MAEEMKGGSNRPNLLTFPVKEKGGIDPPPPPPQDPGMHERITKVEGAIDGLKHTQNIVWGGVVGVAGLMLAAAAIVVTLQFYVLSEVNGITDKIAAEFRSMRAEQSAQTSAIANSITATKQQAPQVILVPAPQVQPPPQQ